MEYPEINKLYKYRCVNDQTLMMLINREIWFSTINTFNDSFEGKAYLRNTTNSMEIFEPGLNLLSSQPKDMSPEEIADFINRHADYSGFNKQQVTINKILDEHRKRINKFGIYCLSEDPESILMWSHYADENKGICLEFQRTPYNLLGSPATKRVDYAEKLPTFTIEDLKNTNTFKSDPITTKFEHWKYEKEWRAIIPEGNKAFEYPGKLTKIIFGLRTSLHHKRTIFNATKDIEGIKYAQIERHADRYAFKIIDLIRNGSVLSHPYAQPETNTHSS